MVEKPCIQLAGRRNATNKIKTINKATKGTEIRFLKKVIEREVKIEFEQKQFRLKVQTATLEKLDSISSSLFSGTVSGHVLLTDR